MITYLSMRTRIGQCRRKAVLCVIVLIGLIVPAAAAHSQSPTVVLNPLSAPPESVVAEARLLTDQMINAARGPYKRLRWHCKDGAILPPEPYACKDHGGGRQYAEYSDAQKRLAGLGWPVGTIYAALRWQDVYRAGERNLRLRDLALERYLTDVDNGWVLRRARDYRGRVQQEDEAAAGRELLLSALAQPDWVAENYLLMRELVRVVPHGVQADAGRAIRRSAQDIAERNPAFEPIRIEIHTEPSRSTSTRINDWLLAQTNLPSDISTQAQTLAAELEGLYGGSGRGARLAKARLALQKHQETRVYAEQLAQIDAATGRLRLKLLAALLKDTRVAAVDARLSPVMRLSLLDTNGDLETELLLAVDALMTTNALSRRELLSLAQVLTDAVYGSGLLTKDESEVLGHALSIIAGPDEVSLPIYLVATRTVDRSAAWGVAAVRYTFAEALVRYTALNPRAAGFVDDTIRNSPLMAMARVARQLSYDAQRESGVRHVINGTPETGMLALNAGIAVGKLRIVSDAELTDETVWSRDDIVLLPQTVSELRPVAGVLTRGEGNLLSHVQILARNFGIPNVALTAEVPTALTALEGQQIVLAVGSAGSVSIESLAKLRPAQLKFLGRETNTLEPGSLQLPPVDLSVRTPVPLADLHRGLSGKVVGPKAANLGELARLFPGRVAAAIALPFGLNYTYVSSGADAPRARLEAAYKARRAGTLDEDTLLTTLSTIRTDIAALTINETTLASLLPMMESLFGPPGSYGLFIRSDTNVEDLPGFSGAGLSETLPNVVGLDAQLAGIPRVWSSVLSPRAIAWRSNLLAHPEEVYASVLLMRAVPSEKSGVMVTTDLSEPGSALTVSTAWGVGGAVAGEAAETIVLLPNGTEKLIASAMTPYRRHLSPAGGLDWLPARAGRVLTVSEKAQLRKLADEVAARYKAVPASDGRELPWDIEFGFVDGELTLFQIRPLSERGAQRANRFVSMLLGNPPASAKRKVSLDEPVRLLESGQAR